MSGADKLDSTCVNKPPENIILSDDTDLSGLKIGIPKVLLLTAVNLTIIL